MNNSNSARLGFGSMLPLFLRASLCIFISIAFQLVSPIDGLAGTMRDYVITGKIELADGTPISRAKVQAGGNTTNSRTLFWNYWPDATDYTDQDGFFRIETSKSMLNKRIRVRMKLSNGDIAVREYLADTGANWRPIAETEHKVSSAAIDFGSRILGGDQNSHVYTDAVRDALYDSKNITRARIFSLMNRVREKVDNYGGDLEFNPSRKIIGFYPVPGVHGGLSYALDNTINITKDSASFPASLRITVFHEMGHIWIIQHKYGSWMCGAGGHDDICPSNAFNEGFAEYFVYTMSGLLGLETYSGISLVPYPYECAAYTWGVYDDMTTLSDVERYMHGVTGVLRLLTYPSLYESFDYGDYCEDPDIAFKDVLRVFMPAPNEGWSTKWQTGTNSYGVWRFTNRARDILPQFSSDYRDLIVSLVNPQVSYEGFREMIHLACNRMREEKGLPPVPDDLSAPAESPDDKRGFAPVFMVASAIQAGQGEAVEGGSDDESKVALKPIHIEAKQLSGDVTPSDRLPTEEDGRVAVASKINPTLGLVARARMPGSGMSHHGVVDDATKGKIAKVANEATTDDEEELASDHSNIVDEESLPAENDNVVDETNAPSDTQVRFSPASVDESQNGSPAEGSGLCSLTLGASPSANIFLILFVSIATLGVVRFRKY